MRSKRRQGIGRRSALVFAVVVCSLVFVPGAFATNLADIHSASGPLTDIWIGDNNLSCQVAHTNDSSYEFFSPSSTSGSCGTFLSVDSPTGAQLFGISGDGASGTPYTVVSQSPLSGDGSSQNPFQVTTVDDAGTTGLRVTQVDSYIVGNEYYQTDVTVTNNSALAATGKVYHAADCYLQGSDAGYGWVDTSSSAIACTQHANNSPPALIEEFAPATSGSHYVETGYASVFADVNSRNDLPNSCDCSNFEDNGMGINWDYSLAPGQSQTFTLLSNFSPNGTPSPTHTITASGGQSFSGTSPETVNGTLATFSDSKSGTTAADYSATIDWGDGSTPSQGVIAPNDSGGFTVSGNHTYTPAGSDTITVTISGKDGQTNQPSVTDSVSVAPSHTISATGGQSFSGTAPYSLNGTVATFSDSKSGTAPGEYTATIDWGDDSSSAGSIQAASGGGFDVTGQHTYQSPGKYTITVTISDVNKDATDQSVTDSASVTHTISASGGRTFSGTAPYSLNGTVATFTDSKSGTAPGEYTATIDWGDDSSSAGSIQAASGGGFDVTGQHTYQSPGKYTITVTISDVNKDATDQSVTDSASVTHTISASGGQSFSGNAPFTADGTVATFTDSKSGTAPSDYTASIDWGDGSNHTQGGIKTSGSGFAVTGTHTYNNAGSYTITVTISAIDGNANSPSVTDTATVNAPSSPAASPAPTTSPPTAETSPTSTGQSSQGQLTGTVNPGGLDTTVHWIYGLDASYRGPGFSGNIYDQSTPDQPAGSGTSDESVSATVTNLVPNAVYHYRLVATNSKGTTVGQDRTFKTASDSLPSTPVIGQSGNFTPAGGTVFVLINGQFVKLTEVRQLPNGTVVDALHGSLTLTVDAGQNIAAAKRKTYTGTFGGAVFKVNQARKGRDRGLTTLSIVEGAAKGTPSYASCRKKAPRALGGRILQTLRSRASGRFRTRGRYAAGTVRGTRWTTSDRCDGTLISVQLHSVLVNDLVKHISVLVSAGHFYFAAAHPAPVVKPPPPAHPKPPFTG